jgi:hypothetical protein
MPHQRVYEPARSVCRAVVTSLAFVFAACGDSSQPLDVYVGGLESTGTHTVAKYWMNGRPVNLTDGTQNAAVNGIAVSGNDIYAVGTLSNGTYDTATIWKNGQANPLATASASSVARAVGVSGSDVYVAGIILRTNNDATLWKNGEVIDLFGGDVHNNEAHGLAFDATGAPVVAGYVNHAPPVVATYWDPGNVGTGSALSTGGLNTYAYAVAAAGGNLYFAGRTFLALGKYQATGWTNASGGALSDGSQDAAAVAIAVSGTDVYRAGYNGKRAVYWRNQEATYLTDGLNTAAANGIAVEGGDVYVVGYESNGTHLVAKCWKNAVPIPLTDGTQDAQATSIFIRR